MKTADRQPLTTRQAEVLRFLRQHTASKGYPPTYREIARAMGIKDACGVVSHLEALERKGYIRTDRTGEGNVKARTITVLDEPLAVFSTRDGVLPVLPERPLSAGEARELARRLLEAAAEVEQW